MSLLSPIQHLVIKEAQPDAVLTWEAIAGAGGYSVYRAAAINFTPGQKLDRDNNEYYIYRHKRFHGSRAVQQYYIVIVNNP